MKWLLGEFAMDAPDVSDVMRKCPLDIVRALENHSLAEDLAALCEKSQIEKIPEQDLNYPHFVRQF